MGRPFRTVRLIASRPIAATTCASQAEMPRLARRIARPLLAPTDTAIHRKIPRLVRKIARRQLAATAFARQAKLRPAPKIASRVATASVRRAKRAAAMPIAAIVATACAGTRKRRIAALTDCTYCGDYICSGTESSGRAPMIADIVATISVAATRPLIRVLTTARSAAIISAA